MEMKDENEIKENRDRDKDNYLYDGFTEKDMEELVDMIVFVSNEKDRESTH